MDPCEVSVVSSDSLEALSLSLSWIGDIIDPGGAYMATPYWVSLKC
jgi:hypothetical protein